jgi:hypothetical protein
MQFADRGWIVRCLEQVGTENFQDGELAFLALTGKPENPIRDRVGWRLQCELGPKILVAREWRRRDLVLLQASDPSVPLAVLEFKAGLTNEIGRPEQFARWLAEDVAKLRSARLGDAALFWIALHVAVDSEIGRPLNEVVKYRSLYNLSRSADQRRQDERFFVDRLSVYGGISRGTFKRGKPFHGFNVDIDYAVVGPIAASSA